ncbi:MAG: glycine--tRNA ligase [Fimbriiglobus sp.]
MAKFAKFCKDNGFIFQSSEIYGGINGFWDYGPLGVELKKNIKDAWWQDMVRNPPPGPDGQEIRMVGLDCSIIMNPKVWIASGHVGGFSDPMVNCSKTGRIIRADKVQIAGAIVDGKAFGVAVEADNLTDGMPLLKEKLEQAKKKKLPVAVIADSPELKYYSSADVPAGYPRPSPEAEDGVLSEPRAFNLMFETHTGPIQSPENLAYLRPETAQGIFANFKNVMDSTRLKLPFGIGQVGKAFRNEVNPRNFIFRSREFEQMEIEFFCHPSESMKWYQYWRDLRKKWYTTLNIKSDNLKPREQGKEELAFYSIGTTDIEYMFPFSEEPQELEGVAHRGAYDLTQHAQHSGLGDKLAYFDQDAWMADADKRTTNSFEAWLKTNPPKEEVEKYKFIPHVIEPSAGADRFALAVLCEAYTEDSVPDANGKLETRVLMKFHPRLAPVKAAIFPLVNKEGMPEKAMELYRSLKPYFNVAYDASGAVGRRYRRQDEVGTPFCITIDGDTMKDGTVTIRDRDTTQQRRIPMTEVKAEIEKALHS